MRGENPNPDVYEEQSKIAALNAAFMELVNHPTNPLTNQDLERAIGRWPERYERFPAFSES